MNLYFQLILKLKEIGKTIASLHFYEKLWKNRNRKCKVIDIISLVTLLVTNNKMVMNRGNTCLEIMLAK